MMSFAETTSNHQYHSEVHHQGRQITHGALRRIMDYLSQTNDPKNYQPVYHA
jgi:hypothetical protein